MSYNFFELTKKAVGKDVLKKLVFSRPRLDGDAQKITARLCSHRGKKVLALEYSLKDNTVSQKNIGEAALDDELLPIFEKYSQINLITLLGDAERKLSKKGKECLIGADRLERRLADNAPSFVSSVEELDRRKNYILTGEEDFLKKLGISDKNGRVHDKKQGKFRQINRFLEHIENVYEKLPSDDEITVFDLCCGKSYLSFAVYYYLTEIKKRRLNMLAIDLKESVIEWCSSIAKELGYRGMRFVCDDIKNAPKDKSPDMVISLHACDVATDIVIDTAIELGAKIILSTPCCHRYLNDKLDCKPLNFVNRYPHLNNKLCEALTDSIRLARLRSFGYNVSALELTDPENTPKNTLIRAVKNDKISDGELKERTNEYTEILKFVLGSGMDTYLEEIKRK